MTTWRLEVFEQLTSTSDFCVARAKDGEPEGLAVLAAIQTGGRGSRGRAWQSPEGNLNLSVLLRPNLRPSECGIYALLAGVAVADAVNRQLHAGTTATLKWPNDVLLDGSKFAGILIDAAPSVALIDWLVIGIGVNLVYAPAIAGRRTTSLSAHGMTLTAQAATQMVLDQLSFWLEILKNAGTGSIRSAWLDRAHPIGAAIEVKSAKGVKDGVFAGLSDTGALLMLRSETIERIDTGEIFLVSAGAG